MVKRGFRTKSAVEKGIHVTSETALPELLDDAAREPIIRKRPGMRFRLSRDEGIHSKPDPEYVLAVLDATLRSWADVDVDEMIREVRQAREDGSRPPDRP